MKESKRGTYVQIRDIVELIRKHHRRLRSTYEERSEDESNGRRQLVLRYLARCEEDVDAFLERYAGAERRAILDTWIQYSPAEQLDEAFGDAEEGSPDDARDLAAQAVALDRALVGIYEQLEERSAARNVRRFFAGLRDVAETRMKEDAEDLQQARDL